MCKTEFEKCMDSEFFFANDKEILAMIRNARRLTQMYNASDYDSTILRRNILENLLGAMGGNILIDTPFYCDYGKNIYLGSNVIININCTFVDCNRIDIGNDVMIASNVQMYTATHPTAAGERLVSGWDQSADGPFFRTYSLPIKIEDRVWIGGGAIILPGVTIGENSMIGAGSVVNKDIPANSLAVGNPCRVVKDLTVTLPEV